MVESLKIDLNKPKNNPEYKDQKELENLKTDIVDQKLNSLEFSNSSKQVLDLLKNKPDGEKTNMYKKLEGLEGEDFDIEKFANDIDKTVKKFLYQSLVESQNKFKLDDKAIDSVSVAIQFSMMKSLTQTGEKGSDFFSAFSDIKTDDTKGFIGGLFNVFRGGSIFGKIGKANEMYVLANRFQNMVGYISYHSGENKELGNGLNVVEIMNSSKCVKLLENPVWDSQEGLFNKKLEEVGFTVSNNSVGLEMSQEDRIFLQNIADEADMPIDKKTINSIKKALPTAQLILEKRFSFKENISDIFDTIGGILDINLFGFGTIGSLFGIKSPAEFLRSQRGKKKGILDFILVGLGFQGGVEGLHRDYVRKNIDKNLDSDEKKDFISDMFTRYNKEKNYEYKGQSTLTKFNFLKIDESLKSKVPDKYDVLKESIIDGLQGNEVMISPNILMKYGFKDCFKYEKIIDKKGKEITKTIVDADKLDKSKLNNQFVDEYLGDNIKQLATDENFMKDIGNSDQFALALMGNLVVGNWFIEGVVIGEEVVENYLLEEKDEQGMKETDNKQEQKEPSIENRSNQPEKEVLGKIDSELKKYNSNINPEDVLGASKQYRVPVEYIMAFMKNDSTYATAGKGVRTNNPGNIGNDDEGNERFYADLKTGVYEVGKHLKWRIDEFHKVYGFVVLPTAKQLADNIGPDGKGFLSSQLNYKIPNPDRKGAYMTAKNGGIAVNNYVGDLISVGISNYSQIV